MKILLIFFTFYLISGAVRCFNVSGYSGGSVLVDSGKLWFSDSPKYMAKLPEWRTIINHTKHNKWINEGRFTLFQNNERNLMIYIRDLNQHDAGRYQIGPDGQSIIDMTLNVEEDSCCKVSNRVMVNIGETASFSCEYSQNHINHSKIIFKEGKDSVEEMIRTYTSSTIGRFSGYDCRNKKLIILRITAVTPDDGGVYLCGIWIYRHSFSYSIITTLHLHVITKVGVSSVSGYSGGGLMIKCEHPQYKTKPKYICKESDGCSERKSPGVQDEWMENGDVSLYDNTRAGVLMVFFRELKAADAGTYRCGVNVSHYTEIFTELQLNVKHDFSMIIIISVCVILLLIGGFTLTVWKLRHKRRDPGSVQINSNDDLPTIPSDGLLYAAVSFQKHEESLSDAAVRFSKDDVHCDYTAVSHCMRLN
ncbi:hypothetical protein QQF64_000211 [Cirrhinus molitorella]|uniref:Ig-like domain-containing protein n=1 Tax=Cirrhinus molitorella TaxID=172907 RepID=A0ABR3NXH5_9TELE